MSTKQLNTLFKFEKDKESKAAAALQQAESDYQQNLQRLNSVGDYRLEYMKRLNQRSIEGIDSATYNHFHKFVAKLDHAGEQVEIAIRQSKALVEQKRTLWLQQRQKIQAVELLLIKQQLKLRKIEDRREQNMFDEISTQRFLRKDSISQR